MKKQYLKDGWLLNGRKIETLSAEVPGCVHTDLRRHEIISDYFWRDNNQKLQWIEECDWTYTCRFDAETGVPAKLVFEGLDTYCSILLNGEYLGETNNMFISHSFDVTNYLQDRDNVLGVCFRSPIKEVEDKPELAGAFTLERLHTRRMQCTYGWDWVERFVTCGIWRPVYLEYGEDLHVKDVYIYTESIDRYGAQVGVEINLSNYEQGGMLDVELLSPDDEVVCRESIYVREEKAVRHYDIDEARLWYPNGYGEQPIYTLRIKAGDNEFTEHFGIRLIRILQLTDKPGSANYEKAKQLQAGEIGRIYDRNEEYSGFQVLVNGVPILCKGGCWVPCEPFPSFATIEKYNKLVELAASMNMTMLRVWGGGLFEDKAFYDACDRNGILVQQDFLMACGYYPEKEEWFIKALQQESEYAVKALRNHPCLAWWNGDNENAVKGSDLMEDYCGRDSALKGIEPNINQYDSRRQFLRSSPYGGNTYASITRGTTHNTNYLINLFEYFVSSDCKNYKEYLAGYTARFISEEPIFGATSTPSMLKFMTENDLYEEEEVILRYHTKNNPCLEQEIYDYVKIFTEKVLGEFRNICDRYFKYKYIQYEWVRVLFENCRRNLGYCNGLIFWMFNDCWPAALGWSLVDYYCIPKAAYYAFKRCAKHITGSIIEKKDACCLYISNDYTEVPVEGKAYKISNGEICEQYEFATEIGAYSVQELMLPWKCKDGELIVCEITDGKECDRTFYRRGNLEIREEKNAVRITECNESSITVTAERYVHVVELEGQYIFSDNYFSLLPGESKTVCFKEYENEGHEKFTVVTYNI